MRNIAIKALASFMAICIMGAAAAQGAAAQATAPTAPATGQEAATAAATQVTLALARQNVLERSAALRKAGIAVDSALLTEKGEGYAYLPSVSAGAKASLAFGNPASLSGSASLSVTQPIWDGGAHAILLAIDKLATKEAQATARAALLSALETADSAYYAVLAGKDALAASQSDLDAAKASLDLAEAKLEAGIIAKTELLQVKAAAAASESSVSQAKRALQAATMKLASITGLSLPLEVANVDFAAYDKLMRTLSDLGDDGLEVLVEKVTASAAASNPSLSAALYASDRSGLSVDKARVGYLPSVSASWSNGLSFADTGVGYSGGLSISASIPLDLWNTAVDVSAARLAAQSSRIDYEETRRQLELDIRTAVYDWVSAARSIYSSRQALDYAESNYESVLESYRLSLSSASDLSDAAALVSTDRKAWNQARYDFLLGLSALRSLAGLETDDLLVGLVP